MAQRKMVVNLGSIQAGDELDGYTVDRFESAAQLPDGRIGMVRLHFEGDDDDTWGPWVSSQDTVTVSRDVPDES